MITISPEESKFSRQLNIIGFLEDLRAIWLEHPDKDLDDILNNGPYLTEDEKKDLPLRSKRLYWYWDNES